MSAPDPDERNPAIPLAMLRLCGTGEAVRTYMLGRDVTTLGRSSSNDIVLPDETVSRRHCRIFYWAGGHYIVEDLNSSNGTYLNKEQIQIAFLATGDTIRLGDQTLEFTLL